MDRNCRYLHIFWASSHGQPGFENWQGYAAYVPDSPGGRRWTPCELLRSEVEFFNPFQPWRLVQLRWESTTFGWWCHLTGLKTNQSLTEAKHSKITSSNHDSLKFILQVLGIQDFVRMASGRSQDLRESTPNGGRSRLPGRSWIGWFFTPQEEDNFLKRAFEGTLFNLTVPAMKNTCCSCLLIACEFG